MTMGGAMAFPARTERVCGAPPARLWPRWGWALVSQRDPLVLTNEHGKVGWSPSRSKAWLLPFNQALAHARDTSFSWELLMLVADWTSSKNLDD